MLGNDGTVIVSGGELDASNPIFNRAAFDLSDATLRADSSVQGGLEFVNSSGGSVRILGGENQVYADYNNRGGSLLATGDSTTTFFEPVFNSFNGGFSVTEGSTVVFLDRYGGAGILGDGEAIFHGEFDPALLSTGPNAYGVDAAFTSTSTSLFSFSGAFLGGVDSSGVVDLGGELIAEVLAPLAAPGLNEVTIIEAELVEDEYDFLPEIDAHLGARAYFRGIEYTDTSVVLLIEQFADGDLNGDGVVDASDYDAWAADFGRVGVVGTLMADGNLDGRVDAADYTLWRNAMDAVLTESVPEPGACLGLLVGAMCLSGWRSRLSVLGD